MIDVERVRPARPLTERQARVVAMLSDGLTYFAIGRHLGCSGESVRALAYKVARRIPGNLEPRVKCIVWWRGASLMVLLGGSHSDNCQQDANAA